MYGVLNTEIITNYPCQRVKTPLCFKLRYRCPRVAVMLSKVSGVGVLQANPARWSCVMLQCYIGTQESKGLFGLPNAADFMQAGSCSSLDHPPLCFSPAPKLHDTRSTTHVDGTRGVPQNDAGKKGHTNWQFLFVGWGTMASNQHSSKAYYHLILPFMWLLFHCRDNVNY